MTSKDKKETIVALIFFAAAACILGYYFFGHKSAGTSVSSGTATSNSLSLGLQASNGATGSAAGAPSMSFLPNGTSLDTSVFNNSVFENLVAPIYPTVSASDVGVQNPFVQK